MSAAALLLMSLPLAASAQPAGADSVYCVEQFRQWQREDPRFHRASPELADLKSLKLRYPDEAIRDSLEGTVVLWVLVANTGEMRCVKVIERSEHEGLDKAALEAAYQAVYAPATDREGKPFETWMALPLGFEVSEGEERWRLRGW